LDIDVRKAGTYHLEIRHAAAESRPLKLIVNGKLIENSVVGQVTGSWNPDGQRWFPAGTFELHAGVNTIKLESDKVHPHVDRLAVIYAGPEPWPFASPQPTSLLQIATKYDVNPALVSVWQEFLKKIENDGFAEFGSFRPWVRLAGLEPSTFEIESEKLLTELKTEGNLDPLNTLVISKLLDTNPRSLTDVAQAYQAVLDGNEIKEIDRWRTAPSPLAGPKPISPALLSAEVGEKLRDLQQNVESLNKSRPTYEVAMGVTDAAAQDLRIHLRGSHIALGDVAVRRFPRAISQVAATGNHQPSTTTGIPLPKIGDGQSGRLQLAQWLTHPDHPLTWRVIVNRAWHWHFGRGLTPSVDNFGLLGQPPMHPKLLDWLTRRMIERGGSIKELHRLLMLSSTYQMSTEFNDAANAKDPDNQLLWRFRRRRQSGEELRDSLIALGTGFDPKMGGSLLKVANRSYVTGSGTSITDEYKNYRRSVYLPVVRSSVYEVLQTFDFPDPAVAAGARQSSTVAPQALMMMNSALVEEQTEAMAKRLVAIPTVDQRIANVFRRILHRIPTPNELTAGTDYISKAQQTASLSGLNESERELRAWQSYCRIMLSSNEFAYVE